MNFKLVLEKAENQRSTCQNLLDHRKSKRVPEKHLSLLYWLCQSLCVDHSKLWKILKQMGIPDHLTCLLRNLYAGQEATVRTGHGTTDWFQRKGVYQGCILSSCLFNLTYSFPYLEPVCCSMSSSNCGFLTCKQISQEAGQVVWPPLEEFSTVCCDPHSQRLWHSQ